MNLFLQILFGGLGGAVLASGVAFYIHRQSQKKPTGHAYELLKKIERLLQSTQADYYFTESADDNYHVANHIYMHADATIIATAFSEDPSTYGERDIVRAFRYGSLFTRITCQDVCPLESSDNAKNYLEKVLPGATFVVIPEGEVFTRIDGIYCKFKDGTYLCAIAFRDPDNIQKNKGVVFRNGIAKGFFDYYQWLIKQYTNRPLDSTQRTERIT